MFGAVDRHSCNSVHAIVVGWFTAGDGMTWHVAEWRRHNALHLSANATESSIPGACLPRLRLPRGGQENEYEVVKPYGVKDRISDSLRVVSLERTRLTRKQMRV